MDPLPTILSIQSHTVHGYVGNRSAVFPLQLLGCEVDAINSVQFSNHTGYPVFKGDAMQPEQLAILIDGLRANNLLKYDALLTGYVRSAAFLQKVLEIYQELRTENPSLLYLCDPVLGDNGEFYCPKELVSVYRDQVLPRASVLTPNQFEIEQLIGCTVKNEDEAWSAMDKILAIGPHTVFLTSCVFQDNADKMLILASNLSQGRFKVEVHRLDGVFTGTGDLFSALVLAWLKKTDMNVKTTLENVVGTMQSVLKRTIERGGGEIQLVASAADIMNPTPIPAIVVSE